MKPSIPKGTRDFSPVEMNRRNYIFDTIKKVFQKYGYQQIETPSMENLETLTGKYGDEGDKLLFKILNSGDFTSSAKVRKQVLKDIAENSSSKLDLVVGEHYPLRFIATPNELINDITEKGLRYDLTVPFARYVVMHQHEITFPFKRYQIQPVWRADRPQKGRYREFYQCDVDVIGSDSLLNEVELIQIIDEVFTRLGMEVTIKINNRKLLQGLAEVVGATDRFNEFITIIDKLDKKGREGVIEELTAINISTDKLEFLVLKFPNATDKNVINNFRIFFESDYRESSIAQKGIDEVDFILRALSDLELKSTNVEFNFSLVRGLNYYTGAIFEVVVNDSRSTFTSSISGGGRYDDLTGIFGLPNVSGVGVSFGVDRIYDVMEELGFPEIKNSDSMQLMFVNFGKEEEKHCLNLVSKVRAAGISAELYPDQAKLKKQFAYADSKMIPYVAVIGVEEMRTNKITLKNMSSGVQEKLSIEELVLRLTVSTSSQIKKKSITEFIVAIIKWFKKLIRKEK